MSSFIIFLSELKTKLEGNSRSERQVSHLLSRSDVVPMTHMYLADSILVKVGRSGEDQFPSSGKSILDF